MERKLDALQAEQAELTRGREEIIQWREALKAQVAQLQMRIFTLEKDNEALEQNVAQLEQYKQERAALSRTRQEEIESIREKNERLRVDIDRTQAEAQALKEQAAQEQGGIRRPCRPP